MTTKYFILFITACTSVFFAEAQNKKIDSGNVAATFKSLRLICRSVDFADSKTSKLGMFYKAAPFIIYRGSDKKREWKDFANYNNPEEKKGVDAVCTKINETVNRDSTYKIEKYFTEKESEGTWHVLIVSYKKKGIVKNSAFAFLKIGNRFGLGDID